VAYLLLGYLAQYVLTINGGSARTYISSGFWLVWNKTRSLRFHLWRNNEPFWFDKLDKFLIQTCKRFHMYIPAVVRINKKTIRNKTEKNNDKRSIHIKLMSSASSQHIFFYDKGISIISTYKSGYTFCIVY
jgi:hypothetical protein